LDKDLKNRNNLILNRAAFTVVCASIDDRSTIEQFFARNHLAFKAAGQLFDLRVVLVHQDMSLLAGWSPFPGNVAGNIILLPQRGLSMARNFALRDMRAGWMLFLDIDCNLDEDFFENLHRLQEAKGDVDVFVGQVMSLQTGKGILRRWPTKAKRMHLWDGLQLALSVNAVYRVPDPMLMFDERFGLGAQFGSCEDVDYFLMYCGKKYYSPNLRIYHPELDFLSMPDRKRESYSYGFGAFVRKRFGYLGVVLIALSILKKTPLFLAGRLSGRSWWRVSASQFYGFFDYTLRDVKR
jgi:hypothetical protein